MKAIQVLILMMAISLCLTCDWLAPVTIDNRSDVFVKCIKVNETPGDYWSPVSAWGGSEWGIAWQEEESGSNDIFFNVIGADEYDANDAIPVSNISENSTNPSLVWNNNDFGLIWTSEKKIHIVMLDDSGAAKSPVYSVTGDGYDASFPVLVWNGSYFYCAWGQGNILMNEGTVIHFQKFGENGEPVGPERFIARGSLPGNVQSMESPMLSWHGRDLSLVFSSVLSDNRGKDIFLVF
jgi:hypothetical protein